MGHSRASNAAWGSALPHHEKVLCLHCNLPVGLGGSGNFCCAGCAAIYSLLSEKGLKQYYNMRDSAGVPATAARLEREEHPPSWLELLASQPERAQNQSLELDIQGVHCSGCIWLISELFKKYEGGIRCMCNPTLGTVSLHYAPNFALKDWVQEVQRFGYRLAPRQETNSKPQSQALILRLGICAALSANTMIFAAANYFGLQEGTLFGWTRFINLVLATLAVVVGGSFFFRSSLRALSRGMLHFDIPISLGIALSYAASVVAYTKGHEAAVFFDSIVAFITLMLLGRFLQQRMLEQNRQRLLSHTGFETLLTRRLMNGQVKIIPCTQIAKDDVLIVPQGEVVPVEGRLLNSSAQVSLEWLSGESHPVDFAEHALVPAGAFNIGKTPLRIEAQSDAYGSPLAELLRRPYDAEHRELMWEQWWQKAAKIYLIAVMGAGLGSLLTWGVVFHQWSKALDVAAAVLIVSCPCAFALATPLAYELAYFGLRRAGLWVRQSRFLERAARVRSLVFDKTGTLTTGALTVANPETLQGLTQDQRSVLYTLTAVSGHPKSRAISKELELLGARVIEQLSVEEIPSSGVQTYDGDASYRFGDSRFALNETQLQEDASTVFSRNGRKLAAFEFKETLRCDAKNEITRLQASGYATWILSGDKKKNVVAAAEQVGIPLSRALSEQSVEDKARWLEAHSDARPLFVGDGINDLSAAERSFCSGTIAVERSFIHAATDFYFTTPGLRPIALALRVARHVTRLRNRNFAFAIAYNLITISLAWAGMMRPWMAAVLMPTSSLLLTGLMVWALSPRRSLWTP